MRRVITTFVIATGALTVAGALTATPAAASAVLSEALEPCRIPNVEKVLRCGVVHVEENRARPNGRKLPLKVIVVPARSGSAAPDPVFALAGGPGQTVTEMAAVFAGPGALHDREVVLVDQRGTGEGHRLDCDTGVSDENIAGALQPLFYEGQSIFRECRKQLEARADLSQYTTAAFVEDLNEVRRVLGYQRINLEGGSYGTRAALAYIQKYPETVRSALLNGVVPFENRSPLYHAAAAQRAFDLLVEQCESEPACREAFPDVHGDLAAIRQRLLAGPVGVEVPHPGTGAPVQLALTESAFADGLRVMLYSAQGGRNVPLLLQRGRAGDLAPFAKAALASSLGLRKSLRLGLLLSVSCPEDAVRISPDEIEKETGNSFIGDSRVRGQMAACADWAPAKMPVDFFDVRPVDVPALLVSGHLDPVTPPHWGETARKLLPNSLHVVGPGAHTGMNPCLAGIRQDFFTSGKVDSLATGCVTESKPPPFALPGDAAQAN